MVREERTRVKQNTTVELRTEQPAMLWRRGSDVTLNWLYLTDSIVTTATRVMVATAATSAAVRQRGGRFTDETNIAMVWPNGALRAAAICKREREFRVMKDEDRSGLRTLLAREPCDALE